MVHMSNGIIGTVKAIFFTVLITVLLGACATPYYPVYVNASGDYYITENQSSVGYYGSTIFYDSLLIDVTTPRYYSFVSNLAFALGYLGGAVLLAVHTWMIVSPDSSSVSTWKEGSSATIFDNAIPIFSAPALSRGKPARSASIVNPG